MNFDLEKMVNNTRKEIEKTNRLDNNSIKRLAIDKLFNLEEQNNKNYLIYNVDDVIIDNNLLNSIMNKILNKDYEIQLSQEDIDKLIEEYKKENSLKESIDKSKEIVTKSKEATKESESLIQNLKDKNEVENKLIHNKENNKTELIPKNTKVIVTDPMFKDGGIEAIVMDYCKGYDKYLCVVDDMQSFYIDKKYIEIVKPKIEKRVVNFIDNVIDKEITLNVFYNNETNKTAIYYSDLVYESFDKKLDDEKIIKKYYQHQRDKYNTEIKKMIYM